VKVFLNEDFLAGGGVGDGVRLGGGGGRVVEDGARGSEGRTSSTDGFAERVGVVGGVEWLTDAVWALGANISVAD
jgi:hypothetical protein